MVNIIPQDASSEEFFFNKMAKQLSNIVKFKLIVVKIKYQET